MVQSEKFILKMHETKNHAEMCCCWVLLAITLLTFNTVAQIQSTADRKYRRTVPLYFLMQRFLI